MYNLIAADAGGTKSELVLFNESGQVLKWSVSPGCNAMDIGRPKALERVISSVENILPYAGGPVKAFFGGIAGVMPMGDFISDKLAAVLPEALVRVEDDGINMISGELEHEDGCGMVCGTGSSLFIRKNGVLVDKLGGKGYLIDTGGSGFEFGRAAICMAIRSEEQRCEHTVLQELISEIMGKPVRDSLSEIYDIDKGGRAYIASFAHTVFEGRRMGDRICQEIFDRGAYLLADLTYAAERFFPDDFKIVLNGGLPTAFPELYDAVVEKSSKRAVFIRGTHAPIYGAALEAAWSIGIDTNAQFKEKFLHSYAELLR